MNSISAQPPIRSYKWGCVISNGNAYTQNQIFTPQGRYQWIFKATRNPKTYPSKTQYGSTHLGDGGIAIADVVDVENTADIIILSRGNNNELITNNDLKKMKKRGGTIEYLQNIGKKVYCLRTPEAVTKYQDLTAQGKKVTMLLHLTC